MCSSEVRGSSPASTQGRVEGADRKTVCSLVYPAFEGLRLSERSMGYARPPNKAPEPTLGAVTPRAVESVFDVKPQKVNRSAARGAPAPSVAHL